jgi:excisionase family DNA binding protein
MKGNTMVDERWFTVAYIVELLDVHEQTVRRWLKDGRLKGRSFGGKTGWRVKESDLEAFLSDEGKAAA